MCILALKHLLLTENMACLGTACMPVEGLSLAKSNRLNGTHQLFYCTETNFTLKTKKCSKDTCSLK